MTDLLTSVSTVLSQPVAVVVAVCWLLGSVVFVTWWVTRRVSRFATWQGVARMIEASNEGRDKEMQGHKQEDLRMFQDMADRYQRGMEMASERFTEGTALTAQFMRDVSKELKAVNEKADKNAIQLGEVRGALRVLISEDKAKEIFKESA